MRRLFCDSRMEIKQAEIEMTHLRLKVDTLENLKVTVERFERREADLSQTIIEKDLRIADLQKKEVEIEEDIQRLNSQRAKLNQAFAEKEKDAIVKEFYDKPELKKEVFKEFVDDLYNSDVLYELLQFEKIDPIWVVENKMSGNPQFKEEFNTHKALIIIPELREAYRHYVTDVTDEFSVLNQYCENKNLLNNERYFLTQVFLGWNNENVPPWIEERRIKDRRQSRLHSSHKQV